MSVGLSNGLILLSELRFDSLMKSCSVSTKTVATPIVALYHEALHTILTHP